MNHSLPVTINRLAFAGLVMLHLTVLFVLPLWQASPLTWALFLLPMLWLNIVHWGVIHEAIHKLLFPSGRANEWGGRILAILMGTSFHVLRFGHLMHHQLNRQFHSEQVAARTLGARAYYYFYLLAGLYLSEVVTGLLFLLLPRRGFMVLGRATFLRGYENVAVAGERFFYERGNIRTTRVDVIAGITLYAAAFSLAGTQWPWLLAFVAIRGLVISFMDNIYHFDTPADNSKPAKELALAPRLSALILYGNYHETHHSNPDVPWAALPEVHHAQRRGFDGGFGAHGLLQFNGPSTKEMSYA